MPDSPFSPIPDILDDLRQGKMVLLTDDENRENEGDLVLPAQFVTPQAIGFMLSVARGYLCLSLTAEDCNRLDLPPQTNVNTSARGTAFTVTLDLHPKHGGGTGVSTKERAACIRRIIDPTSTPDDFVRPGHINPLRARDGGTLVRTGHTEGSIDLCRLAGLTPAACIIEVLRPDGEMARLPDLIALAKEHNLKLCSVAQIIHHRLQRESLVRRLHPPAGTPIRTAMGHFNLIAFESLVDPLPHIALTVGGVGELDPHTGAVAESPEPTLVRMHRKNLLGDIFADLDSSPEGPTADTLRRSMQAIATEGRGALIYLRPEGVAVDTLTGTHGELEQRLRTIRRAPYTPGQDHPDWTHPAGPGAQAMPMHQRDFGIGGQILRALGLRKLRLLTNHQKGLPGLDAFGLEVVERVPIPGPREPNPPSPQRS